jgi:hypothetical protein
LQKSNSQSAPYLRYIYLLVLLPCLIYTVFYTARAIRLDYTVVPFWDTWRNVQYVDQLLRFDLPHFWVPHNEHRIVFPEMVYALDYIFFRGQQFLPIVCNILCQLVQLAVLWWLLQRMQDMPLAVRLALFAGCSLFMTTAMQVQGILGTFELQWYLSEMAAVLSFLFLWRSAATGPWFNLAISIAAAVIVTYSTSNGMTVWPVLLVMAALLRLPKPRIACVALAGVFSIAMYFVGYSFMAHGRTAILLAHPLYAIWFVCVFLGTPISYASTSLGGLAGLGGLMLIVFALLAAIRERRTGDPVLIVPAGLCLYIACSAVMIAYGRMDPADPAFGAALPTRYVSVPLTYCANLVVVVGWLMMWLPRYRPVALHLGAAALTLLLVVGVVRPQKAYERAFAAQQALGQETGIALVAGVQDPDVIRVIFPDPPFVVEHLPAIRQRRLSIFADGYQDWIGQPIGRVFVPGAPSLCAGSVDTQSVVTGGYRLTGSAVDRATGLPPANIVLTNPAGAIIGFGQTRSGGYPRGSGDPIPQPPLDRDWVGFARDDGTSGIIAHAIVQTGKTACALGSQQPFLRVKALELSQVGAPIHIAAWQVGPGWTQNGFHPSVGTLKGEFLYGSYSGSDANQGVLTSAPFATGGHDCIALPVAHGPSTGGQSIRLVDVRSGRAVASIPLDQTAATWQYWAVELRGMDQLRIEAEDKGSEFGQWSGVGEPHECRP